MPDAKMAEDLTPTPTQAENDAAMTAASGVSAPTPPAQDKEKQPAPAHTERHSEPARRS